MPSERALEIAELAAPDACETSRRIIANQIDGFAIEKLEQYLATKERAMPNKPAITEALLHARAFIVARGPGEFKPAYEQVLAEIDAILKTEEEGQGHAE